MLQLGVYVTSQSMFPEWTGSYLDLVRVLRLAVSLGS